MLELAAEHRAWKVGCRQLAWCTAAIWNLYRGAQSLGTNQIWLSIMTVELVTTPSIYLLPWRQPSRSRTESETLDPSFRMPS